MKALYFNGKIPVYKEDMEIPIPEEKESLVKIKLAAVCNTDKEILRGYRPGFEGIMGHEFVGIVEKSKDKTLVGKRVVAEINSSCGTCVYCTTGRASHCRDRKVLGIHGKNGCFAEYIAIDTKLLHPVPECLPDEKAVFTEPLAAAYEILTQIQVKKNTKTAILGDGRLALCVAKVLSCAGASLTVIGRHKEKLALFEDIARTDFSGEEEAYELVVEATGSPEGLEQALKLVRHKGIVVLKSTYAEKVTFNMSQVAVNEITIVGSRCGPFAPALELLESGKVQLPEIELYPLAEYEKAFASAAFKAGFYFDYRTGKKKGTD